MQRREESVFNIIELVGIGRAAYRSHIKPIVEAEFLHGQVGVRTSRHLTDLIRSDGVGRIDIPVGTRLHLHEDKSIACLCDDVDLTLGGGRRPVGFPDSIAFGDKPFPDYSFGNSPPLRALSLSIPAIPVRKP